jgi:hypothetical protein
VDELIIDCRLPSVAEGIERLQWFAAKVIWVTIRSPRTSTRVPRCFEIEEIYVSMHG